MSKTDENNKTKKVGPPPIRHGVDYINPEEEDQMVFKCVLYKIYTQFVFGLKSRKSMAIGQTFCAL